MYVIGITGGSCSGKSTIALKIKDALATKNVSIVHMDRYYKKQPPNVTAPFTGIVYAEHNHPDALRLDDMYNDFNVLINGDSDVVIIEGLFALYLKDIREKLDLKIFVDLRSDDRIVRRIKRFMRDNGQTMDEVTNRFLETVRFRHDELVEPTRWYADIILNGCLDLHRGTEVLIKYIKLEVEKL